MCSQSGRLHFDGECMCTAGVAVAGTVVMGIVLGPSAGTVRMTADLDGGVRICVGCRLVPERAYGLGGFCETTSAGRN